MLKVAMTHCQETSPKEATHKSFLMQGTIYENEKPVQGFSVTVFPAYGERDYEDELPDCFADDDEPIQIAIGEYFVANNIDVGRVGR